MPIAKAITTLALASHDTVHDEGCLEAKTLVAGVLSLLVIFSVRIVIRWPGDDSFCCVLLHSLSRSGHFQACYFRLGRNGWFRGLICAATAAAARVEHTSGSF